MPMNKLLTTLMMIMATLVTLAQTSKEDLEVVQLVFGKSKKAFVSEYMKIDKSVGNTAFWNLHEEYERQRRGLMQERYDLISIYIDQYFTLDNETAGDIAKKLIDNTEGLDKLNNRYYRKFEKKIGGLKAATLFQIELYFQTSIQAGLQDQIPLIGQLQIKE